MPAPSRQHPDPVAARPRIAINAQLLSTEASYRGAGIANYIRQVLSRLPGLAPDLDLTAFVRRRLPELPISDQRVSRIPTGNPLVRILWEQSVLPTALARVRADLFHSMAFALPWVRTSPTAVTVYDLSFVLHPEGFRQLNRLYLTAMTRRSAQRADAVIAISENTKSDLVRRFGVAAEKVHVAYCGVEERFQPLLSAEVERFRSSRGLPDRLILFIGTIEPRKNLVTLMEAFALLKRKGLPHRLVVAGGLGWMYQPVFDAVSRLGLTEAVSFPGFVPADELPLWYNVADLFVYPSLYEGFGLPPLEAMACGVPVIVSDRASLPEVVGPDGITVSATDAEALADAIHRVLTDAEWAKVVAERGLARAATFTWGRTAAATLQVYRTLLGSGD